MDVTQTTAPTGPAATPATPKQENLISSDFETFLVMLTAQMENQDPLNPLDSQDFATQLATFSGVEQQVKTNDLLAALNSQFVTSSLGEMASWVGMEARVSAPVQFDGAPIELLPDIPNFAESARLTVRNGAGEIVQQATLPVSNDPIQWAGVGENGQPLPAGQYSFSIDSLSKGEVIDTKTPETYVRVSEVRNIDGQAMVILNGGQALAASSVLGLRQT